MSEFVINFDNLEKTAPLEKNCLIYHEDFDALHDDIRKKVESNVRNVDQGGDELAVQPCFFINGGRGSGKSTFLRALRHRLCEFESGSSKIGLLADVDPTELADSENFFIHILGRVHYLLQECHRPMDENSREKKESFRNAYSSIQKMAKGLGMLARRAEFLESSSDASFFVQESVEACVSSAELKKQFAALIQQLCSLLKVQALLVTVDDADMNFNKCREIFETVRKYLLNPRMVFVFAGDLKLYTMVVRGMQLNHFGEMALKYDNERRSHRQELLDNLEDQYVMKLLPVANRVYLSDFSIVLNDDPKITATVPDGKLDMKLVDYLETELPNRLRKGINRLYMPFLKGMTIRSALQLIAYWVKRISKPSRRDKQTLEVWAKGVRMVASHALIKHQVDVNSIHRGDVWALGRAVYQHVAELNCGIEGASLAAGLGEATQQMVSFYLSSVYVWKVDNLKKRLSYIFCVYPMLQTSATGAKRIAEQAPMLEAGVSRRKWGAFCTSLLQAGHIMKDDAAIATYGNGVIPLFSSGIKSSMEGLARISIAELFEKLVKRVEEHQNVEDMAITLALVLSISQEHSRGQKSYFLSIYNTFSVILELLDLNVKKGQAARSMVERILHPNNSMLIYERDNFQEEDRYVAGRDEENASIRKQLERLVSDKCKPVFDKVVDEVMAWLPRGKDAPINDDLLTLNQNWQDFYYDLMLATSNAPLKARKESELVHAGDLFVHYLRIFVKHILPLKEDGHSSELEQFPLLNILFKHGSSTCLEYLNQVNVGPVELFFDVERYKERWIKYVNDAKEANYTRLEYEFYKTPHECTLKYEKCLSQLFRSAIASYESSISDVENNEEKMRLLEKYKHRTSMLQSHRMEKMRHYIASLFSERREEVEMKCEAEMEVVTENAIRRLQKAENTDEGDEIIARYGRELRFRGKRVIDRYMRELMDEYSAKERMEEEAVRKLISGGASDTTDA